MDWTQPRSPCALPTDGHLHKPGSHRKSHGRLWGFERQCSHYLWSRSIADKAFLTFWPVSDFHNSSQANPESGHLIWIWEVEHNICPSTKTCLKISFESQLLWNCNLVWNGTGWSNLTVVCWASDGGDQNKFRMGLQIPTSFCITTAFISNSIKTLFHLWRGRMTWLGWGGRQKMWPNCS